MDSASIIATSAVAVTAAARDGPPASRPHAPTPRAEAKPRAVAAQQTQEKEKSEARIVEAEAAVRFKPRLVAAKLSFQKDPETGEIIALVIDPNTMEVIRQVPPEELRDVLSPSADLRGLYVDKSV